jgi:hypothetical protein
MNDTTVVARHVARRIRQWQRRLAARLQAGDTFARQAGWTITPTAFGGRIYRDPRFSQLTATHAPPPPQQTALSASGPAPAATGTPGPHPALASHWRPGLLGGTAGGTNDQQQP